MIKYLIRTEQNGGEYYGYTIILCKELNISEIDKDILFADNVKIQFCELIEEIYLVGEEDGRDADDYHYSGADEAYEILYSIYK